MKSPGEYRSDDEELSLLGCVFPSRPCPVSEAFAPYLPVRLKHKIKGRILFKCAVELNMLCHTIAAHFRADPIHTRELRAYALDEVKRTNGQVSFESAVRQQRRIEYEEDDFE